MVKFLFVFAPKKIHSQSHLVLVPSIAKLHFILLSRHSTVLEKSFRTASRAIYQIAQLVNHMSYTPTCIYQINRNVLNFQEKPVVVSWNAILMEAVTMETQQNHERNSKNIWNHAYFEYEKHQFPAKNLDNFFFPQVGLILELWKNHVWYGELRWNLSVFNLPCNGHKISVSYNDMVLLTNRFIFAAILIRN